MVASRITTSVAKNQRTRAMHGVTGRADKLLKAKAK